MSDESKELKNSRRRFYKATYTPVKTRVPDRDEAGDALARAALIRALQITPGEASQLRRRVESEGERAALEVVAGVSEALSADRALAIAARLARIPDRDLISIAKHLGEIRRDLSERLVHRLKGLDRRFTESQLRETVNPPESETMEVTDRLLGPAESSGEGSATRTTRRLASRTHADVEHELDAEMPQSAYSVGEPSAMALQSQAGPATFFAPPLARQSPGVLAQAQIHPLVVEALGTRLAARAPEVLAWAGEAEPDKFEELMKDVRPYLSAPATLTGFEVISALPEIDRRRAMTELFVEALTRRPLEPVGLLHLERLEMTPLEVERGELVYSLPLAPREKVTLAHKEWRVHEEEFSRYVQDYMENFSERGVAEADELAMSSETQARHSNALSLSQSPVATSGVTITNPVDATNQVASSVDDTTSRQESKTHSRSVTAKASARTIKDHKVSFTVTTVSGVEDFTARVIENRRRDETMLIDYYRRMRRWRTDLYRYGVRMTYDVVLPDPGHILRSRYLELKAIDAALAAGFEFNLRLSDITPLNWKYYAGTYGVALQAPPPAQQLFEDMRPVDHNFDTNNPKRIEERQVTIPNEYTLESLTASANTSAWVVASARWINVYGGGQIGLFEENGSNYINGSHKFNIATFPKSGNIKVIFVCRFVQKGVLRLTATAVPTEATIENWRTQCWARLRDAAYADFVEERDRLREHRAALVRELNAPDALTLRRMEREQIMYLVLQWLFPNLDYTSDVWQYLQSSGLLLPSQWQQVMEYGEYIKFVHSAIDWDNVMVFLYPYFWDAPWRHDEKLFLDHSDPIHREFLRAGAARVVLAIRPGYEEEIASLLDQAQLGSLPDGHRFKKVAEDVREANAAYSETDGQAEDEESEDNPREPGVLIGSWFDYTPSGAIDIDVTVTKVHSS